MQFYRTTRDLHLYLGLFISPFVLVFALSVFYINHPTPGVFEPVEHGQHPRTVGDIKVSANFGAAQPVERVQMAQQVMRQLGVTGEIGFIRTLDAPDNYEFQVLKPGSVATIRLDVAGKSATLREADTRMPALLVYLHKSPGPHNAAIRGNWSYTRWWRLAADSIVYLLLFISISGVYLWAVLKSERRLGLVLLGAGLVSFVGIVVELSRI